MNGNNNSLDDVKRYANGRRYKAYKDDDCMFFFDEMLNDGSDDNYFQLGFHIDATYKLIKYFYPLIVFTDLNHKFYPIAFMITSHEIAVDYVNFFSKLKEVSFKLIEMILVW